MQNKLLTILLALVYTIIANAQDFTIGDFSYRVNSPEDNTVLITRISLEDGADVVIPSTVKYEGTDYTVVGIYGEVNTKFRSLYIPKTFTRPGEVNMFVYITDEYIVEDGHPDFKVVDGCLYSADGDIFYACPTNVEVLEIKPGTKSIFGRAVLKTNVHDLRMPESLERIEDGAIQHNNFIDIINLPEGLKYIGAFSFGDLGNVTEIYIPAAVEHLESMSFNLGNIQKFTISDSNVNYKVYNDAIYSSDFSTLITCAKAKEAVSIHPETKVLEPYAFTGASITSIDIPSAITEIPANCFNACPKLETVTLHEGLKTIAYGAFIITPKLETVVIPESVESINCESFGTYHIEWKSVIIKGDNVKVVKEHESSTPLPLTPVFYTRGNTYTNFSKIFEAVKDYAEIPILDRIPIKPDYEMEMGSYRSCRASSYQFDLTMPVGLTLNNVSIPGNNEHQAIAFSHLSNGDTRVVVYDTKGESVGVNCCMYAFAADSDLKPSTIKVHNIIMSLVDTEITIPDIEVPVTGYIIETRTMPTEFEEGDTYELPNPLEGITDGVTYQWVIESDQENIAKVEDNTLTALNEGRFLLWCLSSGPICELNYYEICTVTAALWGDADRNGAIDVADVVAVLNHILERGNPVFDSARADIDRNGRINVADLTLIIKSILSQAPTNGKAYSHARMADTAEREVSFGQSTITSDNVHNIPLSITPSHEYTALQTDITIPQGMKLVSVSLDESATHHSLDYAHITDDIVRIIIYSSSLASFRSQTLSPLMNITLSGNPGSDGTIRTANTLAVEPDGSAFSLSPADANIANPTAVSHLSLSEISIVSEQGAIIISTPQNTTATIYDMSGRELISVETPTRIAVPSGIYFVKVADKIEKVAVK